MDLAVVVVGSAADVEVVVVTEIGLFVFFLVMRRAGLKKSGIEWFTLILSLSYSARRA